MRPAEHSYRTISSIKGPLLFVEKVFSARTGEIVRIISPSGEEREGEVLKIENDTVLIEVFGETKGLDIKNTTVVFTDSLKKIPLSEDMIGRVFSSSFKPLDDIPLPVPEKWAPVTGYPMNPVSRARPEEFIETGLSVIDGLNTLVKGQKLPVFSCAGLPSKEVVAFILRNARIRKTDLFKKEEKEFVIVFGAMGLTFQDYSFFMKTLEEMEAPFVAFINMADQPVLERLLTPRYCLTVAEYLAFDKSMDVLVVLTDMTNYCDALREVSTAREELPGRRGYPGYMYSDLASIYERAGRLKNIKGSITLLPVVTMPEDDITHPIPDLTGYITEGQIVLSRELHQKGLFPPVDVLPSLSRLMQNGIGEGRTRGDHRRIANLLYKYYAKGRDLRRLEAIVGREGLTEQDRKMLEFADLFEREFVNQYNQVAKVSVRRDIIETLDKGIECMKRFRLIGD
jgi:V/A-type H+-transporting ATPase subunit B